MPDTCGTCRDFLRPSLGGYYGFCSSPHALAMVSGSLTPKPGFGCRFHRAAPAGAVAMPAARAEIGPAENPSGGAGVTARWPEPPGMPPQNGRGEELHLGVYLDDEPRP